MPMSKPIIALTDFKSISPESQFTQSELFKLSAKAHAEQGDFSLDRMNTLFSRYGVSPEKIQTRSYESIETILSEKQMLERTQFFAERSKEVLKKLYESDHQPPRHLIHVTCTGYASPSAAQTLVNHKAWNTHTAVTHAYHMGCYASLPAIRIAEGFGGADIVHTEMCGLHFDPTQHSAEQIVVQTLFADGHIRYSAVPTASTHNGLEVLKISEMIVPNSEQDMSWITGNKGMQMTLSREVPTKIGGELRSFVQNLVSSADLDLPQTLKSALFAVHPGGPRIIDSVQNSLELSDDQISASRKILRTHGNMSSATLPHVWQEIISKNYQSGQLVVSLAFGPGLTMFGAVFRMI